MTTHETAAAATPQDDARARVFERIDEILDAEDAASQAPELTAEQAVALMPAVLAHIKAQREQEERRKQATSAELDLMDRMKDADDLLCVYANNGAGKLPGAAEALYDAAGHLIQHDDAMHQRTGYVMALDAFLASPDALVAAVRTLRQRLVTSAPALAMRGEAPASWAVPRSMEIDGVQFHLRPTGELVIERSDGGGIVELKPSEAFAVLTFMRVPGVATLIEQIEAEDEAKSWHDFVEDQRREMTREEAYRVLATDRVLAERMLRNAKQVILDELERQMAEGKSVKTE